MKTGLLLCILLLFSCCVYQPTPKFIYTTMPAKDSKYVGKEDIIVMKNDTLCLIRLKRKEFLKNRSRKLKTPKYYFIAAEATYKVINDTLIVMFKKSQTDDIVVTCSTNMRPYWVNYYKIKNKEILYLPKISDNIFRHWKVRRLTISIK